MSIQSEQRRLRESVDPAAKLLPVGDYQAAARYLRAPFAPEAVSFRVVECWGANDETPCHAIVAPYIDARTAMARLNMVITGMWSADFKTAGPVTWCGLTVRTGWNNSEDTFRISDVGEGGTEKARRSDALKRAAVSLGVGESLYAVPPMQVNATGNALEDLSGHLRSWMNDGDPWLKLTRAGEDYCRDIYRRWLLKYGIPAFGRPIDHGNLTAESETVVTGPPRPRASREQVPTPTRRQPSRERVQSKRGEKVVGGVEPEAPAVVEEGPEGAAGVELDKLLNATDGLAGERKAASAMMVAHFGSSAVKRLAEIREAEKDRDGARAGLERLIATLSSISQIPKAETGETEDRIQSALEDGA